ncbi:MAG: YggT family protein [Sulfurimicrobium sp.]|nr:YggT family protein [Sulfurimicrobium sp.]MDP1703446.1 YggT family protein [Sulfurimicrobium sp.]MDP2198336.1 YggT family protein [Sulfurimicrobium sp.]MDP3689285.1 YggT family protein [Sulfurimicrobium sp.]
MLNQALLFLIDTLLTLVAVAFLLRFQMQLMRVPFRNPVGQFLLAVTDFAVKPLRRILPGWLGWDWSSLVAAWAAQMFLVTATALLLGHGTTFPAIGGLAFLAAIKLLALAVNLVIWTAIVSAILTWVQPYHWLNGFAHSLVQPFLRPLQKLIPTIGNVDLSVLALILLGQLVLMLPIAWLEQLAAQMM